MLKLKKNLKDAQRKPWMNVPRWSKLKRISPAQGEGSNEPCVGREHVNRNMHGAHF